MKGWIVAFILSVFARGLAEEVLWRGESTGGFSVKISLSSKQVRFPDPIDIDLLAESPLGYQIDAQEILKQLVLSADLLGFPFQIINETDETDTGAILKRHLHWRLKPLRIGTFFLTFLNLYFHANPDLASGDIALPCQVFQVIVDPSLLKEEDLALSPLLNFHDRYGQFQPETLQNSPEWQKSNFAHLNWVFEQHRFPWVFLLLMFSLLQLLVLFKWKGKEAWEWLQLKWSVDSQSRALATIHSLENQPLVTDEQRSGYFLQLAAALRHYEEVQYGLPKNVLTTQEFLSSVKSVKRPDDSLVALLESILPLADRIEFGDYVPTVDECRSSLILAESLVLNLHDGT